MSPMVAPGGHLTGRRVLRTQDAASYVGLSARTLERMRQDGDGPRITRLRDRAVGYDVQDLDRWIDERRDRGSGFNG